MEYEKELQLKTVQCQEMDNALKLEQNLNTKLYDDVSVCLYIALDHPLLSDHYNSNNLDL